MERYNGIERGIFADMYNFFLKYKDIPNDDYYLGVCMDDAKLLMFKWKDNPFAKAMLQTTLEHLMNIIKGVNECGYTREQWEQTLEVAKNGRVFNSSNPFNSGR